MSFTHCGVYLFACLSPKCL